MYMVVFRCQCSQWQQPGPSPPCFRGQIRPRSFPPQQLHPLRSIPTTFLLVVPMMHTGMKSFCVPVFTCTLRLKRSRKVSSFILTLSLPPKPIIFLQLLFCSSNLIALLDHLQITIHININKSSLCCINQDPILHCLCPFLSVGYQNFHFFDCRPVSMTPQMAQPAHSAGQMLAQMSRQNGASQSVTPSSTSTPLHGGPAGGWAEAGAGVRPQFNNQVSQ